MLYDFANSAIWLCCTNWQLRPERDGDTEKGCHNPAVQKKTTEII